MKNNIALYRKSIELSQYRLAKKVGISRNSINKIENGKSIPSLETANNIAKALNASIYQIFDLN